MGIGNGSEKVVKSVEPRGGVAKSGNKWGGTPAWWTKGDMTVPEWSGSCGKDLLRL